MHLARMPEPTEQARPDHLPDPPYPGIDPFTYAHRRVFFSRDQEIRALTRLIAMYRGILLYSDSGTGKSSLINAGLIPAAIEEGLQPERIRVQPQPGGEIIVERTAGDAGDDQFHLPSVFAGDGQQDRVVLPVEDFLQTLRRESGPVRPLLVFDQFEEWYTLFEEGSPGCSRAAAQACRNKIRDAIVSLLNDTALPVTLMIALREDYLAKLDPLFQRCPTLPDHYLRLLPLKGNQVYRTITGPFEEYPGRYSPELPASLAKTITAEFETRPNAEIHLTEVQIVCRTLFDAGKRGKGPEEFFAAKGGVRGILQGYMERALEALVPGQRQPAISLLSHMITSAGTRNVISEDDLVSRVSDEESTSKNLLVQTLASLEHDAKLVRRERRREVYYYEIASEFLVDWIRERALERQRRLQQRKEEEQRRFQRRKKAQALMAGAVAVLLVFLAFAVYAGVAARRSAQDARNAKSLAESKAQEARAAQARANQLAGERGEEARRATQAYQEADAFRRLAERLAQSSRLTQVSLSNAISNIDHDPERSVLWVLQALSSTDTADETVANQASDALRRALEASRILVAIRPYGAATEGVVFSPDGRRIVTANSDGTARVWDAASGRELRAFYGHADAVKAVAFSPDGSLLATGSLDGRAKIWQVNTGRELRTLSGHLAGLTGVAFGSGNMLATASEDGTARVWDFTTGKLKRTLSGHLGPVDTLAFNANGTRLATAGDDRQVKIWDPDSGHLLLTLIPRATIMALAFSPSGEEVVASDSGGKLTFWDARSGRLRNTLAAHSSIVFAFAFNPRNSNQLATASWDGTAKVWNVAKGVALYSLAGHKSGVTNVAFSPDASRIVTASLDKTVRIWTTTSGGHIVALSGHTDEVNDVAYSPDGKLLATASFDHTVRIWKAASGQELRSIPQPRVLGVAFSPNGERIAMATRRGATVWNTALERPLCSTRQPEGVRRVAFSPDGKLLASANYDHTARIWDANSCRELHVFHHNDEVLAVAFSPDGKMLASASKDKTAKLWEIASERLVQSFSEHRIGLLDVAFSPRGDRLVTASKDKSAKVWDVASGRSLLTLQGHTDSVMAAAFSPDGKRIATGSLDKTIKLWDAASGKELQTISRDLQEVNAIRFSPDGRWLAAAGSDPSPRIYALNLRELRDLARKQVTFMLTDQECRSYLQRACPDNVLDLMAEGQRLAEQLKVDPAREKFRKALALDPSVRDPEKEANRMTAAIVAAKALQLANTTVRGIAGSEKAEAEIKLVYEALGLAVKLDPSIGLDPRSQTERLLANRFFQFAGKLAGQGDLEATTLALDKALKWDATFRLKPEPDARRMIAHEHGAKALAMLQKSQWPEAIAELEKAVEVDPEYVAGRQILADLYTSRKEYDKAVQHLRIVAQLSPAPDVSFALADLHRTREQYEQALDVAKAGVKAYPDYRCGYYTLALIQYSTRQFDEALSALHHVRDTDFCYQSAVSVSAAIYFDKFHDYELAYQTYKHELVMNPDDVSDMANLAEASLATSRYEDACKLAERALQKSPPSSTALAMRFVNLVSLTLQGQSEAADRVLGDLVEFYNKLGGKYEQDWTYTGSRNFISTQPIPDAQKRLLLNLLSALETPAGPIRIEDLR